MTTSSLRRQVKNIVHNYTEAEIKVREATSNDPWGPSTSVMSEIADLTFNAVAFSEVMDMIWRRLNDSGKNWRHVYKALTLLDYLIKTASEKVAHQCRENLYTVQTLKDFQFVDRDGKDQGINVREKAKQIVSLLKDEERLKQERDHALKTKERMSQGATGIGSGQRASYGEDGTKSRASPASFNSASSSSPQLASEIEQARPQTSGEEELQLQLALAMSREEADKPPIAPATDADEELQLQLALSLSKEDHEKEVKVGQGEESLLQKALGKRHPEEEPHQEERKTESSLLELVDIFGPAPVPSTQVSDPWGMPISADTANPWNSSVQIPAPRLSVSPSWEQTGLNTNVEPLGQPWKAADPWAAAPSGEDLGQTIAFGSQTSAALWDLPPIPASGDLQARTSPPLHHPAADPWGDSGGQQTATGDASFDVFEMLPGLSQHAEPKHAEPKHANQPSNQSQSPVDFDLFGDPVPSTRSAADTFDLSGFGPSLVESKDQTRCRTPESFLDPSASSLVNLDALISAPGQSALTRNPFLSGGLSAPSPTNPFQVTDQMKPTLNQMRSVSPLPGTAVGMASNPTRTISPAPVMNMGTTLTPTRTMSPVPNIAMGATLNPMRTVSPVPGVAMGTPLNSMTYSTSLPMPLSSHPSAMGLPSSMSAFQQGPGAAFQPMSSVMPQPLLPFSGTAPPPSSQAGNNPFL